TNASYWFYEQGVFLPVQHFLRDTSMTMLTENVAQFVHQQITHDGDIEMMRKGLEARTTDHHGRPVMDDETSELLYASPGFAFNYTIAWKLIDVFEAHGTDGVAALLNAMREEAAVVKVTVARGVVAWIDEWVAENLADA